MQGILLVDKPKGWTSFDVVNYVRRMVAPAEGKKPKNTKVGHTGTLDPLATGLLVLLVGKEYTRRAGELSKVDKTYEVTMKLGETSTTGDAEGVITPYRHPEQSGHPEQSEGSQAQILHSVQNDTQSPRTDEQPTEVEIKAALAKFTGEIMQTPPIYSAMKINGQRAYKLAREGKEVVLEPRPVTIYSSELADYTYPYVKFTC